MAPFIITWKGHILASYCSSPAYSLESHPQSSGRLRRHPTLHLCEQEYTRGVSFCFWFLKWFVNWLCWWQLSGGVSVRPWRSHFQSLSSVTRKEDWGTVPVPRWADVRITQAYVLSSGRAPTKRLALLVIVRVKADSGSRVSFLDSVLILALWEYVLCATVELSVGVIS